MDEKQLEEQEAVLMRRYAQVCKLVRIPQPEQRSEEWYAMRREMVTASSVGSCLGLDKYKSSRALLVEKCFGSSFSENMYVYHGKKYEQVAALVYQHLFDVYVHEFGLIRSEMSKFLGASPDGIASNQSFEDFCADPPARAGDFLRLPDDPVSLHPLVGRMLEIKCPVRRAIRTLGDVRGEICPIGYWCQVQTQLYACELDECDFFQCDIVEYDSYEEYLLDKCEDAEFYDGGVRRKLPDYCRKGIILEFVKADSDDRDCIWNREPLHVYPRTLHGLPFNELPPFDLAEYKFHRVIYWKLKLAANATIARDDAWLSEHIPKIQDFWSSVQYYRERPRELEEKVAKTARPRRTADPPDVPSTPSSTFSLRSYSRITHQHT